jgi:hypothetical protein
MHAYTSGLDPAASRLKVSGFSDEVTKKCWITTYTAPNQTEMRNVCENLDKQMLIKPLYDVLNAMVQPPFPMYPQFLNGIRQKAYECRIDVSWKDWEWKVSLVNVHDDAMYIFYLKKYAPSIRVYDWPVGGWHDSGVRVAGRAAGAMYDFFRAMWNEQLGRPVETFKINGERIVSHDRAWPQVPHRLPIDLPANTGLQYVQVLRTIPKMNFTANPRQRGKYLIPDDTLKIGIKGHRIKIGPKKLVIPLGLYASVTDAYTRQPLGFAPNGCFEFKVALQKAIAAAEQYIFIADQGCLLWRLWIGFMQECSKNRSSKSFSSLVLTRQILRTIF